MSITLQVRLPGVRASDPIPLACLIAQIPLVRHRMGSQLDREDERSFCQWLRGVLLDCQGKVSDSDTRAELENAIARLDSILQEPTQEPLNLSRFTYKRGELRNLARLAMMRAG